MIIQFNKGDILLNKYTVYEEIGRGNYGQIYSALDKDNSEKYALKIQNWKNLKQNKTYYEKIKQQYDREVTAYKMIDNQNVIKIYEESMYNNDEDIRILVLEYCNGGDLQKKQQLQPGKYFKQNVALQYLKQIINAFVEIHSKNIMHRDLKPQNILLHDDCIKIADFGFSKQIQEDQANNTQLGSLIYMAPQIIEGKPYGIKADIYSLGVIFYCMLYGLQNFPFFGKNNYQIFNSIKEQNIVFHDNIQVINDDCKDLIRKMLKFEESERIGWKEIQNHPFIVGKHIDQFKEPLTMQQLVNSGINIQQMNQNIDIIEKQQNSNIQDDSNQYLQNSEQSIQQQLQSGLQQIQVQQGQHSQDQSFVKITTLKPQDSIVQEEQQQLQQQEQQQQSSIQEIKNQQYPKFDSSINKLQESEFIKIEQNSQILMQIQQDQHLGMQKVINCNILGQFYGRLVYEIQLNLKYISSNIPIYYLCKKSQTYMQDLLKKLNIEENFMNCQYPDKFYSEDNIKLTNLKRIISDYIKTIQENLQIFQIQAQEEFNSIKDNLDFINQEYIQQELDNKDQQTVNFQKGFKKVFEKFVNSLNEQYLDYKENNQPYSHQILFITIQTLDIMCEKEILLKDNIDYLQIWNKYQDMNDQEILQQIEEKLNIWKQSQQN